MYRLNVQELRQEKNFLLAQRHSDVQCSVHLHYRMEIVCVTAGELIMEVAGRTRIIQAGQGTLVLPFEPHSFCTEEHSSCFVIQFSPEFVDDFYTCIRNKLLVRAVCDLSPWTLAMCDRNLPEGNISAEEADKIRYKAVLYPLCQEFWSKCGFEIAQEPVEKEIFTRALLHIGWNFRTEDVSLLAVAKILGVHPGYLSRVFHQCCGVHFTKYVNILRCYFAIRLLHEKPELSVSEVALEAGFGSVRSFNREFHAVYGMTPREKRKEM